MSKPPGIKLATVNVPPSWCNQAGRVDRASCVELRATWVKRSIHDEGLVKWKRSRTHPRPGSRQPDRKVWRETVADFVVTRWFIENIMRREQPRVLKGDWRTARSQAMREHPGQKAVYRNHINRSSGHKAEGWPSLGFAIGDEHLPDNPNRGAARSKILPLGEDWTQTVRIERWRLHALLLDAFLICPVCKAKYKKLFLPMCTQDEWRDAEFARLWLESHAKRITTAPPDSVTRQTAHRLVERYGLLFPPRRFVCKQCLGVRYGEGLRKRDRVPRRQIRARPLAAGRRTRALVIGVGRIGRVHPTSHTARGRPGP